ncbi:MAG: protein translocase subunit SecD [Erysipelotrichaceae bacterium]
MKKISSRFIILLLTIGALVAIVGFGSKGVANGITKGLDLDGGFEIVYEVAPLNDGEAIPDMGVVAKSISKRIDILGVNEPIISVEGDNRVRVQLAGVKDVDQARRIISSTANLSFRDVYDKELMSSKVVKENGAALSYENGIPVVSLKIDDKAKFAEVTEQLSKKPSGDNLIVTWLDYNSEDHYLEESKADKPKYISAAQVTTKIDGDAIIKGNFSESEARELADLINSGSLPVKMTEIYSNVVSAQFGELAYDQTVMAGFIGILLVIGFMITVYRLPGFFSSLSLTAFVFGNMFIYNMMGGVLTLPGIAALVLGVGMAVDANVITFERIKDELYNGRSLQKAYKEGSSKAFSTIFDSQFTTFISALIMYIFGTGAIKGFATMLMVTIFCTLTLQIFLTKFFLSLAVKCGRFDNLKLYGVKLSDIPDVSKNEESRHKDMFDKVDFVKVSKKFIMGSIVILLAGLLFTGYNGIVNKEPLNLGVDFSSGTQITVVSDSELTKDVLVGDFKEFELNPSKVVLTSDNKQATVTFKEAVDSEKLLNIKEVIKNKYGHEANDSVVTPLIGRQLVQNAIILSIVAWILMLIYISYRFELDYAISCIVALVHDVFIVLALFAIFRFEVNSNLIAVFLAIIGYSIDDSIVIFDRIRENVKALGKGHIRNEQYVQIVNDSLRQTSMRSIYNTITTLLPIACLLLIGSKEIFVFNVAMLIGLIAGAYSSLFIAAQLWLYIRTHRKFKPKAKKIKKKEDGPTEMTFLGIND